MVHLLSHHIGASLFLIGLLCFGSQSKSPDGIGVCSLLPDQEKRLFGEDLCGLFSIKESYIEENMQPMIMIWCCFLGSQMQNDRRVQWSESIWFLNWYQFHRTESNLKFLTWLRNIKFGVVTLATKCEMREGSNDQRDILVWNWYQFHKFLNWHEVSVHELMWPRNLKS